MAGVCAYGRELSIIMYTACRARMRSQFSHNIIHGYGTGNYSWKTTFCSFFVQEVYLIRMVIYR